MDITGYPIRAIPSGRPSSLEITQNEALFRLIQEGRHAGLSLASTRWVDDPRLSLNPSIGSDAAFGPKVGFWYDLRPLADTGIRLYLLILLGN